MSYNLFLDDYRDPGDAWAYWETVDKVTTRRPLTQVSKIPSGLWTVARSYREFVDIIESKGIPRAVSFDHDLCQEHMDYYCRYVVGSGKDFVIDYSKLTTPTGYHAAQYLVSRCRFLKVATPVAYVHTINPAGMRAILQVLS